MKKFAFTCGDINGIGPEIVIKTLNRVYESGNKFIFICPKDVFENTARDIVPLFDFKIHKNNLSLENPEVVNILDLGKANQSIGKVTKNSGIISYCAIKESFNLAQTNKVDAVITAPISKHALELSDISYPGHTEMYAEWSGQKHFVMMFISSRMNCALLTIHEPLKKVPELINREMINNKIEVIISSLKKDFGIREPRIAFLGLNPHAGENGRIGREETDIIIPVLKQSAYSGFISGPFVPDAFFANKLFKKFDMVIGMYHDQVLIPFKLLNFSSGVNYTAGLPIIRTSPDHGTAFDIAGKSIADPGSMLEAFNLAGRILKNRLKWKRKK